MKKNYIIYVNDHSGSMSHLANAAKNDYNTNIRVTKEAATREMLDTVVSVSGVGLTDHTTRKEFTRQVMISNPHVLREVTDWPTPGGTPLYDTIGDAIEIHEQLPDYNRDDVSFLLIATTDGEEAHSTKYDKRMLADKIRKLQATGRWTFVFRVPKGYRRMLNGLNVPDDNVQEWETTSEGMARSTAATTAAMNTYFSERSAGRKSSGTFYANASNVSAATVKATLVDISTEVSMWTVLDTEDEEEIKPFAEKRLGRTPFLKGAAFYQLTKTERAVQESKLIVIRDKSNGHVYEGAAARQLIGLPLIGNVRLHPGDHGNYDIFIQSTSINRKLVAGSQVLYWPKVGTGFSSADFPWLANVQANANPALHAAAAQAIQATAGIQPVVSPAPTTKPSPKKKKSNVAKLPVVAPAGVQFFATRAQARKTGKKVHDAGVNASPRWFVQ